MKLESFLCVLIKYVSSRTFFIFIYMLFISCLPFIETLCNPKGFGYKVGSLRTLLKYFMYKRWQG